MRSLRKAEREGRWKCLDWEDYNLVLQANRRLLDWLAQYKPALIEINRSSPQLVEGLFKMDQRAAQLFVDRDFFIYESERIALQDGVSPRVAADYCSEHISSTFDDIHIEGFVPPEDLIIKLDDGFLAVEDVRGTRKHVTEVVLADLNKYPPYLVNHLCGVLRGETWHSEEGLNSIFDEWEFSQLERDLIRSRLLTAKDHFLP